MGSDVLKEVGPAAIEALAEAWASFSEDGLESFKREREAWLSTGVLDRDAPGYAGSWEGYTADAEEMIRRLHARGFTIVPIEASSGLLTSMALRYDHSLFMPANEPDNMFFPYTEEDRARKIRATLSMMRQIHEEVVGIGFYQPEKEADYAARLPNSEETHHD